MHADVLIFISLHRCISKLNLYARSLFVGRIGTAQLGGHPSALTSYIITPIKVWHDRTFVLVLNVMRFNVGQ